MYKRQVQQALRPYPQYSGVFNNFDDSGSSLYNALQVQAERRFSNGFMFLVTYNLSRMMSNTTSGFTSFANASLNKNNQKSEWTIDNNDQPNALTIAGAYELPIGQGKRLLNNRGLASNVLGGWQVSANLTYSQGTPLWNGNGCLLYTSRCV